MTTKVPSLRTLSAIRNVLAGNTESSGGPGHAGGPTKSRKAVMSLNSETGKDLSNLNKVLHKTPSTSTSSKHSTTGQGAINKGGWMGAVQKAFTGKDSTWVTPSKVDDAKLGKQIQDAVTTEMISRKDNGYVTLNMSDFKKDFSDMAVPGNDPVSHTGAVDGAFAPRTGAGDGND